MSKAIALYSGGLDSTLAILVAKKQGIDVTAVTFLTHFGCDVSDKSSCSKDPFSAAEKFGFKVKLCHLAERFIGIVMNPSFGYGKNMNPCIDCRILMLQEAREFMAMQGADFIITGEVLYQRPMSQRRDVLNAIDKKAGVTGYVLRPLSAKLLKPTIPEMLGMVDREGFCSFNGRSRKPQFALAAEFGLTDYPAPASGCLLTDPLYAYRLRELVTDNPSPSVRDINLLRVGRHFRLSKGCKAVVGRDQKENEAINSLAERGDALLHVEGYGSPETIVNSPSCIDDIMKAAAICARYSDAKRLKSVEVTIRTGETVFKRSVRPALNETLDQCRIYLTRAPQEQKKERSAQYA
ncbi:MAG: 7-cyano-7-deazaguanine synthase [Nitrospirae bacterium]|nr:7-cyano-7-deazaguanine synthase [Nitrospirota bacterium]